MLETDKSQSIREVQPNPIIVQPLSNWNQEDNFITQAKTPRDVSRVRHCVLGRTHSSFGRREY